MRAKPVIIQPTGKVKDIPHLYIDPSSGRVYVRYRQGSYDRQVTLTLTSNAPFSILQREAVKAVNAIKREVSQTSVEKSVEKAGYDPIASGKVYLIEQVRKIWESRGVSKGRINEIMIMVTGFAATSSHQRSVISCVDSYNDKVLSEKLTSDMSATRKTLCLTTCATVFKNLITRGLHTGRAPMSDVIVRDDPKERRDIRLTFEDCAKIVEAVRKLNKERLMRLELELFVRLLCETGQRPSDLYSADLTQIELDGHYRFCSHKTGEYMRCRHIISAGSRELLAHIISMRGQAVYTRTLGTHHRSGHVRTVFSYAQTTMMSILNKICRHLFDDGRTLYGFRENFVSVIFKNTSSSWRSAWTHKGVDSNENHYLFFDEHEGDRILTSYVLEPLRRLIDDLPVTIDGQSVEELVSDEEFESLLKNLGKLKK